MLKSHSPPPQIAKLVYQEYTTYTDVNANSDDRKGHFYSCCIWLSGVENSIKGAGCMSQGGFSVPCRLNLAQVLFKFTERMVLEYEDCANGYVHKWQFDSYPLTSFATWGNTQTALFWNSFHLPFLIDLTSFHIIFLISNSQPVIVSLS